LTNYHRLIRIVTGLNLFAAANRSLVARSRCAGWNKQRDYPAGLYMSRSLSDTNRLWHATELCRYRTNSLQGLAWIEMPNDAVWPALKPPAW
jgi:hypothetical protein